jgi:hypothetical protein
MKLSAEIIQSQKEFIARCPELDINCYGSNKKEAVRRLRNVIQFYLDSAKDLGLQIDGSIAVSFKGEMSYNSTLDSTHLSSVN